MLHLRCGLLLALLSGCSTQSHPRCDPERFDCTLVMDAGGEEPDAGGEPLDAGHDRPDAFRPMDAGHDAHVSDGGHTPIVDGGHDAGRDAGRDAGHDAGRDAGHDAGHDAGRIDRDGGRPMGTVTCATIQRDDSTAVDGIYTLNVPGFGVFDAYCLMSADGGGWTMVLSYPEGSPAVPSGWQMGSAVGTAFDDPTSLFKMSDALIQTLATDRYRVRGTARNCYGDASCMVDNLTYYDGACRYDSGANSTECSTAYLDLALTMLTPASATTDGPCPWHWGLVDIDCGVISSLISSHRPSDGISVCVGELMGSAHACTGRGGEIATLEVWVR